MREKIAALISLLLALVLGTAEASEMLRGRIALSPGTSKHNASGSPPVQHCIKVIGLYGQVGCVDSETGEFHQLNRGEIVPSGSRIVTADRAHCELLWKGAAVIVSSKSDVRLSPDTHEVRVVRGQLSWVFMESNLEGYTMATNTSSIAIRSGQGYAIAFPQSDVINVLDYDGVYRSRGSLTAHKAH